MRPCQQYHPEPVPDICRPCWLYVNDARYRAKWDGTEEPGLLAKAAGLAGAVARHAAAGLSRVDDAAFDGRMALCVVCEHYDSGRCKKCGCRLAWKAWWASSKCPVGRW